MAYSKCTAFEFLKTCEIFKTCERKFGHHSTYHYHPDSVQLSKYLGSFSLYFALGVFLATRVKFMSCDVQECGADLRVHQPPARPGVRS